MVQSRQLRRSRKHELLLRLPPECYKRRPTSLGIKLNTFDLKQLSAITRTKLSAEVRELTGAGAELTALEYIPGESSIAQQLLPRTLIFLLHRMYGADIDTIDSQLQR